MTECDHITAHINEKGICEGCGKQLTVDEVFESIFKLKDKIIDQIKKESP